MKIILWILIGLVGLALLVYAIGLLLPKERVVRLSSVFNVLPETLYAIVINNDDWQYRTDLQNLIVIERSGEMEVWDEVSKSGDTIRFKTREKTPHSFYSFDMETRVFTGYWTAAFEPTEDGGTLFTATEYISVKNPFVKMLSYLFFDVKKFMESYQHNLKTKATTIQSKSDQA